VARADERGPRLDRREQRLAVQRDRAAGVRADLRVGEDALRRPAAPRGRQAQARGLEAHDDERRADKVAVRALGIGGVEAAGGDVGRGQRPAVGLDQPPPAAPGRPPEPIGVEDRAGRENRRERGQRQRRARRPARGEQQPLAREAARALVHDAGELRLLGRVGLRIGLLELLRDDEPLADDDQRRAGTAEGQRERDAQPLGAMAEPVDRVEHDEGDRRERAQRQEREHGPLGAAVGRAGRDDRRLALRGSLAMQERAQRRDEDEQPLQAPHDRSLVPMATQAVTSSVAPSSQVTSPSGTGPRLPMPQPPRSTGCCARRT
jgi:hypothetical protein